MSPLTFHFAQTTSPSDLSVFTHPIHPSTQQVAPKSSEAGDFCIGVDVHPFYMSVYVIPAVPSLPIMPPCPAIPPSLLVPSPFVRRNSASAMALLAPGASPSNAALH
eukprot:EG_transcript_17353